MPGILVSHLEDPPRITLKVEFDIDYTLPNRPTISIHHFKDAKPMEVPFPGLFERGVRRLGL